MGVHVKARRQTAAHWARLRARRSAQGRAGIGRGLPQGRDPRTVLAEASGEMTFDIAARELIESMAPGWRNAKHRAQWRMTLLGEMPAKDGSTKKTRYDYCAAVRNKPVAALSTDDALAFLK